MSKDDILEAVTIDNIDFGADPDAETEYFLHFQVTGSIGPIKFTLGQGEEDRYICGAREFDNVEEVLDEISIIDHFELQGLNEQTEQQLAYQLARLQEENEKKIEKKAKMYMDKLFSNEERMEDYFRALISRKLRKEYKHKVKEFMHEANKAAKDAQKSWEEEMSWSL